MCHPVKRSRGREACLVEVVGAVSLDIAFAVLAERGSCPAVVVVLGVEDVVERHAEGDILQSEAGQGKVVAQVHVGIEMCFEEHVHVLVEAAVLIIVLITVEVGVGQILFADALSVTVQSLQMLRESVALASQRNQSTGFQAASSSTPSR